MTDPVYSLTRRRGSTAIVLVVTGVATNPETGAKTPTKTDYTVRWAVMGPTQFSRLIRAQASQQEIGTTTFTMYSKDLSFSSLDQEAYITFGGRRYEVVSSELVDTAFIVTVRENRP